MLKEFKAFAMRGNVVDLAIGVIIGAAFGKIVSSLIDDVITPLLLKPALDAAQLNNIGDLKYGAVKYGTFLAATINFFIVAFVLFLIIKGVNSMKKKEEAPAPPPPTPADIILLTEIRDLLKK